MGSSSSSGCTLKQSCGICVTILALACCLTCACGAVKALYVLGDSQADVGNNNYLPQSVLKANFPHNGVDYPGGKATGRFSNGYNFVDLLGENCDLVFGRAVAAFHVVSSMGHTHACIPL
uniref:GDSL esterase/lipase n=1 Tax=Oryza punctata TaxID=4537 RepID=A0A0E0KFT8_ORYPU